MTESFLHDRIGPLIALGAAIVIGLLASHSPIAAVLVALMGFAIIAMALPSFYWVIAGLIAVILLPGLQAIGILPGFASYLHFPIAFGAFALAIVRANELSREARLSVLAVGLLAISTALATAFSGDTLVRGIFEFGLIAEPFAFLAAILATAPSRSEWRLLRKTVIALLLIQIPVIVAQVMTVGLGGLLGTSKADQIEGTIGVLGGSHILGGMALVSAFWLVTSRVENRWLYAAALLLVPVLAGANQIIYALPLIVAVSPFASSIGKGLRIGIAVTAGIILLTIPSITAGYTLPSINQTLNGEGGKNQALGIVWNDIEGTPASFAFGVGPAETVSGAAYLSTDPLRKPSSPIRYLKITPSQTVVNLGVIGKPISSFSLPKSSAIGVLGDLGVFGLAVYVWFLGHLLVTLYRIRSPEASAAYAAVVLMIILGIVTAGWEEPQFTLFAVTIVGLALTSRSERQSDGLRL